MTLIHPGPDALAWSGEALVAQGWGRQWRESQTDWIQEPTTNLHACGGLGERRLDCLGEYIYVDDGCRWRAVGRLHGTAWPHPSGAVATGLDVVSHAAAPGRSLWPLKHPLLSDSLRFSPNGEVLFGVDSQGQGRAIQLRDRLERPVPGTPLAATVRVDEGCLWLDEVPERPLAEASAAVSGPFMAGPGGCVWDLRSRAPVSPPGSIALGATTPVEGGFATVHWETHQGWTTTFDGRRIGRFDLPLPDDDTAVALVTTERGLTAISAEGRAIDVPSGAEVPLPAVAARRPQATPLGQIEGVLTELDGVTYCGSDSGWLLSWTSDSS